MLQLTTKLMNRFSYSITTSFILCNKDYHSYCNPQCTKHTPKRDPNRAYIFPNFRVSTPPYKFSKQIMENIPYSISFSWIYFINSLFHFISKGVLCVSTLLRQLLQHATPSLKMNRYRN